MLADILIYANKFLPIYSIMYMSLTNVPCLLVLSSLVCKCQKLVAPTTYHEHCVPPFPLFCSMLQKRFRSRDGFPPCANISSDWRRDKRGVIWKPAVISGRSRMEVAITDVAQSRHTRLRYKGFRGDRRPPLSVYIQLWPLCSIQLIICLGSPSPNLFTQLFTQGTRPVFHAGKSLKATHVSSHLEELLSDGRKNHRRKDASKVMHLQSTKCFAMWTEILNVSIFNFCETENFKT